MNTITTRVSLLILLLCSVILIQCSASKTTTEVQTHQSEPSMTDLCIMLVDVIKSNDTKYLSTYFPDVAIARILSPEETKGLSDSEITKNMLQPLQTRFEKNISNLRAGVESNKLEYSDPSYESFKLEASDDPPLVPRVLSITAKAKGLTGNIPVTYIEHEDRIYLFEILISTNFLN